jgi:L-amino acid N-acyltransferase YncA
MMMYYGVEHLGVRRFSVKIGMSNSASISLFTKLGFAKVSESAVFQEVCRRGRLACIMMLMMMAGDS